MECPEDGHMKLSSRIDKVGFPSSIIDSPVLKGISSDFRIATFLLESSKVEVCDGNPVLANANQKYTQWSQPSQEAIFLNEKDANNSSKRCLSVCTETRLGLQHCTCYQLMRSLSSTLTVLIKQQKLYCAQFRNLEKEMMLRRLHVAESAELLVITNC
ncbi:hypothetical protein MUK42_31238 [Musa troglodytarum]|uniref:Uncharacterized protein n=1 Tax=Musa troglodytarum TaxID=320322 RepID=A0A9E7GN38_9LILI|nr:hypothetical protein MUK42_31238 [Musa troglodytarum]